MEMEMEMEIEIEIEYKKREILGKEDERKRKNLGRLERVQFVRGCHYGQNIPIAPPY